MSKAEATALRSFAAATWLITKAKAVAMLLLVPLEVLLLLLLFPQVLVV